VTDADRLREAGLRVTSARLAILEVVRAGKHPGTDEIARAGSPARYESRIGDNHQHIVCRRCGTIADVDRAAAPAPCLEPLASAGFAIERAEVTFWGLCPPCQALRNQPRESMAQGPRP
jgi:Fur family ferric uptake transcriptional regulator